MRNGRSLQGRRERWEKWARDAEALKIDLGSMPHLAPLFARFKRIRGGKKSRMPKRGMTAQGDVA